MLMYPTLSTSLSRAQTDGTDIATVMFGMHEMPQEARRRVLRNALRIARETVLVVDIWPGFEPSPMMLSGEPYVLDYLGNIEGDIDATADEMAAAPSTLSITSAVRMPRCARSELGARRIGNPADCGGVTAATLQSIQGAL